MRLKLILVALIIGSVVTPVAAHSGDSTVIDDPANGSTVGRLVTLTGTTAENCQVSVTVDNGLTYVPVASRGEANLAQLAQANAIPAAGQSDENGDFAFELDLSGDRPVISSAGQVATIPAGEHSFSVGPSGCDEASAHPAASFSVNVQDTNSQAPLAHGTTFPEKTEAGTVIEISASPLWLILLGALLGVSGLALAEASARRYQQKQPAGKSKETKRGKK